MTIQIRRWLPLFALFSVLPLLTLQPGAASVQAAVQSTDTPTPALPVLTPRLGSVPITAQNAAQVKQVMQIGSGGAQNVCWSPDGNTLGVTTTIGLRLYNAHDWPKAPTTLGPAFNASACNWSPHSRYIALTNAQPSAALRWQVAIWRVSDGTLFKAFNDANAVVWSPDGQSFLTTDTDKHVSLWNGVTGALLNRFDTTNAAWSPDSRFVAFIDSSMGLQVWAGQSNSLVFSDTPGWVQIAWAPNSHWLAVRNNGGAVGLAAVDPQKPAIAPVVQLKLTGWNDMSWSPDSVQLATAGNDGTVLIWNAADGSQAESFTVGYGIGSVAWSPTGKLIAVTAGDLSNSDPTVGLGIELLDSRTGQKIFDTFDNNIYMGKVRWSPTGRFLIADAYRTGAGDPVGGLDIRGTSALDKEPFLGLGTYDSYSWSPDDLYIASVPQVDWSGESYGPVEIDDLSSEQNAQNASLYVRDETVNSPFISWSPNGHYLAWETAQWDLFDGTLGALETGTQRCKCYSIFVWGADSEIVATYRYFSQSGVDIAVGPSIGTGYPKDIATNNGLYLFGTKGGPNSLALSSKSHYIAFNAGKDLYIWDIDQNAEVQELQGHTAQINSLAFSADSQFIASGSVDSTIRIWQVDSGKTLHILNGHTAAVNHVVWSPDGKQLASASDDQTVRIWDANSGALLQTLKGHTDSVVRVQWSPDGKLLASASKDGTIKLWDAAHGTLLNTVRGHVGGINDLSWSPDGKTLATVGVDATIRLWGVP